ncbi:hypothetical protein DDP54_05565 [Cellulomonas sp. WB94]|uniref:RsiG family protein n=1 Tax=Cellulomonas sp. WB94 TaxID=2173174 RepID=UPI000D56C3B3|nr:hypothetical protein [Cellulomonas sp. WB94]PVU82556.1 hypothetical protein DDP54_05565 [Cellulomonas sp. WB94]
MNVLASESVRLSELRSSRRALRAERARVSYWRRLVTARIDLALACVAPPDQLGLDLTLLLDGAVHTTPPAHADLDKLLRHSLPITEIHHLDELYRLDERLASYQRDLDDVIATTTAKFIDHLTLDPLAALAGLPASPSPR